MPCTTSPWDGVRSPYLSLGGELREQYWNQVSESDALRTPHRQQLRPAAHRAGCYLHFNSHVSAFGEILRDDSLRQGESEHDR